MLKQALKAVLGVGSSFENVTLNPLRILFLAILVATFFLGVVAFLLFSVSLTI
jgi:hypothetical protein|tara:strand:- start:328 stop:486 length:159 start_codon:yes stop_codon:yes gene_type:complete